MRRRVETVLHLVHVDRVAASQDHREHRDQHEGREQSVAARHLGDHQHGADRRARDAGEERRHSDQHVRLGSRKQPGEELVPAEPDHATEQAADEQRRSKHPSAPARADRERGGEDLRNGDERHRAEQDLAVQRLLNRAPSRAVRLRVPDAEDADPETADHRQQGPGQREAREHALSQCVEQPDVAAPERDGDEREQQIAEQLHGSDQREARDREDLRPAQEQHEHHVGGHRGEHARDQGVHLEVLAVEHLDRGDGTPKRRPEDGPESPGGPGQQQDAAVAGAQAELGADVRADPRADLGDRSLLPRATAGRERDHRGEPLDHGHARWHLPPPLVEGADHLVRTGTLGFGREAVDEQARDQPADGGEQEDQPGPRLGRGRSGEVDELLARRLHGRRSREDPEGQMRGRLEREKEDRGNQARGEPRADSVDDPPRGALPEAHSEAARRTRRWVHVPSPVRRGGVYTPKEGRTSAKEGRTSAKEGRTSAKEGRTSAREGRTREAPCR